MMLGKLASYVQKAETKPLPDTKRGATNTGTYLRVEGGRRKRSRKNNNWILGLVLG